MTRNHVGFWSSVSVLAIGAAYAVALAAGFARHGLHEPIADPILAIMEFLTLVSAPAIVVLIAALHERAAPERRVYSLVAVVFAALFAGTTSAVHFIELTASRQLGRGDLVWPSPTYAAELLAWDVFLGLALLFVAQTLGTSGVERSARRALLWSGWLALAGTVGPAVGSMRLQLVGVIGYAVVLPVAAFWLMRLCGASDAPAQG